MTIVYNYRAWTWYRARAYEYLILFLLNLRGETVSYFQRLGLEASSYFSLFRVIKATTQSMFLHLFSFAQYLACQSLHGF